MKYLQYLTVATVLLASCGPGTSRKDNPVYHTPAIQALTDSIEDQPGNAVMYYLRAEALTQINQDSLALEDMQKARELDPKNAQYTYTAGYLQLELQQYDAAIKTLLLNLGQSPGNVHVRLLLSKAYIASGNTAAAQEQVDKLLAASPKHPGALMIQAEIKTAQKDTAGAITVMKDLLAADPRNYDASYQLADWYRTTGNPEAIKQYHYTFSLDTNNVSPLFEIGRMYEDRQQWQQAKDAYKVCFFKDLDYTDAYIRIGKILLRQDSVDKALRHFTLAINTMPNSAEAYSNKGLCFEKLQQRDSAIVAYRQALVFDNNQQEAREGLKRLKK